MENKMIVEDKILEYLDGSLGEHESAELLETLAVSPEKRALLDDHLRLKDILALGRKAYSVPLATERALAERLPILSRQSVAPVVTGFRSALIGMREWAGSRAIQTAMGVAALVGISVFGWSAMRPTTPQLSDVGQQSFSANQGVNNGAKDIQSTNSAIKDTRANNSPAKDIRDIRVTKGGYSVKTHSTAITSATIHSAIAPSENTLFTSSPSENTLPTTSPSPTNDDQAIHSVTNFSQNDVAIPRESSQSRTLNEIEQGDIRPRPAISIGAHLTGEQSYLPRSSAFASQTPLGYQPDVTLDCDISDHFAIGLEAGQEIYASLTEPSGLIQDPTYSRSTYSSSIAAVQTDYFCLTTHYTFAPESAYPVRLGLAGGIASTGDGTIMGTAGIQRVLSESLLLDLDLVFSRVWGMTPPSSILPVGGVEGIVHDNVTQQTTITSSAGIRMGLRFRL
jgi:hypothetical protein